MLAYPRAKRVFKEYLNNFDLYSGKNRLKIAHTYEVVKLSCYIAKNLQLDSEEIELAKIIALLHDIGRFEQVRKFDDFTDHKNVDHAELGVKVLFDENLIQEFLSDSQYYNTIKEAILNHNKLEIKTGLSQRELLHSKIIRDADKADNFRSKAFDNLEDFMDSNEQKLSQDTISEKIYADFMSQQTIVYSQRETDMDCWVSFIAYIFDFNYSCALRYIAEKEYLKKVINRIDYKHPDTKKKMEKIMRMVSKYVAKRLK